MSCICTIGLLGVCLILSTCIERTNAIRDLSDAQRFLVQDLYRILPDLAAPTLPLAHLLQQRSNVRWITRDVWFENIECAKNHHGQIVCGVYVTRSEMARAGWVDALSDTIDAADDALDWRGYTERDFFVQYDPRWLQQTIEDVKALCLFERGVPIFAQLDTSRSTAVRPQTWGNTWHSFTRYYHCARYKAMKASDLVWNEVLHQLELLDLQWGVRQMLLDKTIVVNQTNQNSNPTVTTASDRSHPKRRLRCDPKDVNCEALL